MSEPSQHTSTKQFELSALANEAEQDESERTVLQNEASHHVDEVSTAKHLIGTTTQ